MFDQSAPDRGEAARSFKTELKNYPEMFSSANKARIATGTSPFVDDTRIIADPMHKQFNKDKLNHYSKGGRRMLTIDILKRCVGVFCIDQDFPLPLGMRDDAGQLPKAGDAIAIEPNAGMSVDLLISRKEDILAL